MDSSKPGLDLERELTCSICTELLYQPLTLLDCLHTYCGACLKDWFSFQANQAENSPTPPAPGANVFTCPSCRASVRDTRHNATVATLLDMLVAANPDRRRSETDVEEMGKKYRPGDQVLPELRLPERTLEERRADDAERRLLEDVRDLSLREAGVESSSLAPRHGRRREDSSSADGRARRSRDHSRDGRHGPRHEGSRRPRANEGRSSADQLQPQPQPDARSSEHRRRRRSESRHRSDESSDTRRRQIEHQSSLRSLISSGDLSERDIEREIEDFARQIQEEGLLDGLDLDNIDLSRNDELSRKITEAYRRRQRERTRAEAAAAARRNNASGQSRSSPDRVHEIRSGASDISRPTSRQRPHSRSTSASGFPEDRSRPPLSQSALHLEVRPEERRRRRRTSSGGRSATTPLPEATQSETRVTTRSQTDLSTTRPQFGEASAPRTVFTETRSSSTPSVPTTTQSPTTAPPPRDLAFASRVTNPSALVSANFAPSPPMEPLSPRMQRPNRPADLSIIGQATSGPVGLGLGMSSPTTPGHQRTRSQLYPEPSITCARCAKQHIEYELHYNCNICASGNWNICLECYRSGKGCLHWFGFGYGAWAKWEKARHAAKEDIPRPHMLTANRYLQPKIIPGGAEGRRTLTTEDPIKRLESGNFCARCLTWANECFWRCDVCNFGDWGFCNSCVNQGRSCTHPLLPLTYQPQPSHTPPASPRSPRPPYAAAVLTGPNIHSIGPFKPLTFTTRCDVCQDPIAPSHSRYHCFTCTSSIEPDTQPGDYDVCTNCYANLEARDQISPENGHAGWRRCLNGHRMIVIGFRDGPGGQLRHILSDLVGGRNLRITAAEGSDEQAPQKWWWYEGGQKRERFVTRDVAADAPTVDGLAPGFPPDGGGGIRASATWAWYPKAEDELLFPRGAEIREIEDVNGDWFFGVYMGAKGLFPSPYVRRLDDHK
ncbi:Putative SH3 domain, Zinc finger, RING-type, Zinc finger, RING/FYVE/PHD-type [Colletotrichum destructivum]|uniref:SH3 domain, Zinc finger, RING-type, Zinc finger, RING/FYVE/PHD-type n=1 Tax=Colletotrichum destructivum TaxID=34406 RepID=A0AAX4HYK1_9PEZI|nr:Putative SH3 domain, Zinc finger, RING-type, Zinc finger, RING/FYVE/PHD-type [Colletotrichum destructivum]